MRQVTLMFLCLAIWLTCAAQKSTKKVAITWTNNSKKIAREVTSIISSNENGFYALEYDAKYQPQIVYYHKTMKPVNQAPINLNGRYLDFILLNKGQFLVFSSLIDNKNFQRILFVQEFNAQTLAMERESEIVTTTFMSLHQASVNYTYKRSAGGSKIAIFHQSFYLDSPFLSVFVFDDDLNLQWKNNLCLQYQDYTYSLKDLDVDENANFYLLGKVEESLQWYNWGRKPVYFFELLVGNSAGVFTSTRLSHPNRFIHSLKLLPWHNNQVKCMGLYSEINAKKSKGVYLATVNHKENKLMNEKFTPFTVETIVSGFGKKKAYRYVNRKNKSKPIELKHFNLNEVLAKQDGGIMAIAEQSYITEATTLLIGGGTRRTKVYHYNDILVVNTNKDGDILWAEKIPKKQISTDDNGLYSSYVLTVTHEKMFFIFNDNPKNIFIKNRKKIYQFKKSKSSLVALVELNKNGNATRESLFNFNDSFIMAKPKISRQISGLKTIIVGDSRGKNWFGEVEFQ